MAGDDFMALLEGTRDEVRNVISAKVHGTVLVKPQVWKSEAEASKAAEDWEYREADEIRRKIAKITGAK